MELQLFCKQKFNPHTAYCKSFEVENFRSFRKFISNRKTFSVKSPVQALGKQDYRPTTNVSQQLQFSFATTRLFYIKQFAIPY